VPDTLVVPRDPVLVRLRGVVLLRRVVDEEDVRQRLEPVRVLPRHVDGERVVVADVDADRLTALAVEDDDAGRPPEADEEVVLATVVVVEATDHTLARERHVRLARGLRQQAVAADLDEPAPLVLDPAQRDQEDALDPPVGGPPPGSEALPPIRLNRPVDTSGDRPVTL
jgi:hypothetical protein